MNETGCVTWTFLDISDNRSSLRVTDLNISKVTGSCFLVGLRQARFISLLIDGATDSGNLEDEIVYIKYVDAKRGLVQRFLGIQDVRHANADGVLATVDIGR